MDEKTPRLNNGLQGLPVTAAQPVELQTKRHTLQARVLRFAGAAAIIYLTLTVLGALSRPEAYWEGPTSVLDSTVSRPNDAARRVPFEAHIM